MYAFCLLCVSLCQFDFVCVSSCIIMSVSELVPAFVSVFDRWLSVFTTVFVSVCICILPEPAIGQNIPVYRAFTLPSFPFPAHSTSFSPKFCNPHRWNVY